MTHLRARELARISACQTRRPTSSPGSPNYFAREESAGGPDLLCGQDQNPPDLEICQISKPPTNEFSGSPTVCISGVSSRTNLRNGTRTSSGQSRFSVSGAKRPLDALLGAIERRAY